MLDTVRRREEIEYRWRARLDAAVAADRAAHERYTKALAEFNKSFSDAIKARQAGFELDEAHQNEQTARADYLRILKIFTELVVHRKLPEADAG